MPIPLPADTEGGIGKGGRRLKGMGSFKLKLVVYFLLLAFLPLAAGYWGFSSIAARSQTRQVDARLQSSLRAGLAGYQDVLDAAAARADRLARQPEFARALARRDRRALTQMLQSAPGLRVIAPGLKLGAAPAPSKAEKVVTVYGLHQLGKVIAFAPLDARTAARLGARSGLEPGDRMVFLRAGSLGLPAGRTATVPFDGRNYRAVVSGGLDGASP